MLDARETLLHAIKDRLTIYAARAAVEQGKLSEGAEEFYRGLLNIMLGCALKNMNHERENFPAIDLGDDKARLCVQVTSTVTRAKVRHTLEEFFEHGLHKRFERLIVLVIGDAPRFDQEPRTEHGFDFQTKRDIWDTRALIRELGRLEDDCLEAMDAYLQKRVSLPRREPLLELPMGSAMRAEAFVGRQPELRRIAEELEKEGVAFLSGLGGMGKTELALRYGQDYQVLGWRHVFFVRFTGSLRRTVVENIAPNIPGFSRDGMNEEQIYTVAMAVLRRCDRDDLLILDNADDAQESVDELRRELSRLPMRVLVTTRAEDDGAIGVGRLENEKLYDIFRNHNVTIPEPDMDALIDAVDGHTLTVDLMARLLRRERRTNTYSDLRDALTKKDLENADLGAVGTAYSGAEGQARINEHLKTVFRVAKLGEAERTLLRFASLLPDCGLDAEIFANAAVQKKQEKKRGFLARLFSKREEPPLLDTPRRVLDVLQSLADGGWLEWEGDVLKIHPVICIVCREELRPTDENCREFLSELLGQIGRDYYDKDIFLQLAELFSAASDDLEDQSGNWALWAGKFWGELGEVQKALVYDLRMVAVREQTQRDSYELAEAYNNVSSSFNALGDHRRALEYQQKALAICEKVLPPEHLSIAISYDNLGLSHCYLGEYEQALECQKKALSICEKVLPPEHPDLATVYGNVGHTYNLMGDHERALEYGLKALEIREKLLPPGHPDFSVSYNNVGVAYDDLGDRERALEYKLKALEIREKALPPTHPELAKAYNNVGYSYSKLGDYERELEYNLKALAILEEVLSPEHPDLAASYNNVGSTYGDLGDHEKALEYQLKALAIREKVLPPEHPHLAASYNNVGGVYSNLGDHAKAMEYQLKALTIHEKVLPANHPYNALSCNNLAWIYYQLGKYETALEYMRRAADIAEQSLPEGHPHRVAFRDSLEWMEREARQRRGEE